MAAPLSAIYRIDKHISDGQAFLALLPRSHPLRTACLFGMALTWSQRHELSDDERDLDMSILHFTHAIFLPFPLSIMGGSGEPNLIQCFYILTHTLFLRFIKFRRPSDVDSCVKHFRYFQDRSLEQFNVSYHEVLTYLISALGFQIPQLEPGYAEENVSPGGWDPR